MNKSIEGTADDEDEGVPTEQAIRAGLELLKVKNLSFLAICIKSDFNLNYI